MFRPLTQPSRDLRKKQTPHEQKLWGLLRGRRFEGVKFRRQHEIGAYITDFCCPEKKIVIELDGGGHAEESQAISDRKRDSYLKGRGYQVLRIWNNELEENQEGVLEQIFQMLGSPSPQPSPQREREK